MTKPYASLEDTQPRSRSLPKQRDTEARLPDGEAVVSSLMKNKRTTADHIAALNSPIRREVLRLLQEGCPLSATQISRKIKATSKLVFYHLNILDAKKVIFLVDSRPVRGTVERFFESEVRAHDQVQQILADTVTDDRSIRR